MHVILLNTAESTFSNFFDVVYEFLNSIWAYIVSFVDSLLQLLQVVGTVIFLPDSLSGLWSPLTMCISVVVLVGLAKLLLGWGNV